MKLKDFLSVLNNDTYITIQKSTTTLYSGRKNSLFLTSDMKEHRNKLLLLFVHNVWYSKVYKSLMIECETYERV
jgi:hypothetical protein